MPLPLDLPAIEHPPALTRAYRCIEWVLNQINQADGYRTNGFVVSRGSDPRAIRADRNAEYEEKMAAATIVHVNRIKDPTGKAGINGRRRWFVTFNIIVLASLSKDEATPTDPLVIPLVVQDKAFEIEDDIQRAFEQDFGLQAASLALGTPRPIVTLLQVDAIMHGSLTTWPDIRFAVNASFLLDEDIRSRV